MAPPSKREAVETILHAVAPEGSNVSVVQNADGSIDGEILVRIERGESVEGAIEDIEHAINDLDIGKTRLFYSTGYRWEPRPGDESKRKYNRDRGLNELFSHYYKDAEAAVALTDSQLEKMRPRRYRKPIQAIFRVHWNRYGIKPPRPKRNP